jgi:pyruvate formate lyase activating enzyme
VNVDPIEKKPLFHFYPGTTALSIATVGCNFRCAFCCNAAISQQYGQISGEAYTPEQVVELALKSGCRSISYTYTEPTVFFEFAYATAKLAHKRGLKNTWVTNGYASEEAVKRISRYLDAATIDLKGSGSPKFYKAHMGVPDVEPIYTCLHRMHKQRVFIEITNLIVPRLGDSVSACRRLAQRITSELGGDVPFHVIQFFPAHRLRDLPATPVKKLERCAEVAKEAGLRYVYVGNVPGHPAESTYCHNCRELLIQREGFIIRRINLIRGRCPTCGFRANIVME